MKIKWIKILLLMILVICLVACESETTPKKESPDTSLETTNVEEDIESEEEIIETEEETPEGNPVEECPFDSEIYSLGHRNIQGLSIHPETGELWASEMGPRGGDELTYSSVD